MVDSTPSPQSLNSAIETQSSAEQSAGTPTAESKRPEPEISWDTAPETLIISATYCCGFVPEIVVRNYIPDAQIFGDGRIIWTKTGQDGARTVLEGRLSSAEMSDFLQSVADKGFFDWKDSYSVPNSPTDLPSKCLSVNLEGASHKVCEYYQGAPQEFHELFSELSAGLGKEGVPYVPQRGYLTATPLPIEQDGAPTEVDLVWDSASIGLSLSEAVNGTWIEGKALEGAWQVVNANPWSNIVVEREKAYQLSLQVPGLSMNPPP